MIGYVKKKMLDMAKKRISILEDIPGEILWKALERKCWKT